MFIREYITKNKKTNTSYITHRLVESIQTDKGPRQRIIMHLGTLSLPKSQWRHLAKVLEARLAGRMCSFEETFPAITEAADKAFDHYRFVQSQREERASQQEKRAVVQVDVESITTGYSRSLGPELAANAFWERLGFEEILAAGGFDLRQISLAKAVIMERLMASAGDGGTRPWLRQRTVLAEMLPVDLTTAGEEVFHEIADDLYVRKNLLERSLREREAVLFSFTSTLFLYDLTNTYFKGCPNNDLAEGGKTNENSSECSWVSLALAVDQLGFPVFSRISSVKPSEPRNLAGILTDLYQKAGHLLKESRPTIVMDRGMATKANIDLLKAKGYPYIVIERRAVGKGHVKEFESVRETFERIDLSGKKAAGAQTGFQATQAVYVKKLPLEEGCRVFCYNEGREPAQPAVNALQERRFLEAVDRLQKSVARGSIVLTEKVTGRVRRLQERYPAAFRRFDIIADTDRTGKKVQSLTVVRKPVEEARTGLVGCYVTETSHQDMTAAEIWRCCQTLTQVAESFRSVRTDLGIRPVAQQIAQRTEAHLFVAVLAYHLLISIEHSLRLKGDHRRWSTLRDQLSTHQRTTVMFTDDDNKIHHVRVSGMPEKEHREIYRLLAVKNPLTRTHRLAGSR